MSKVKPVAGQWYEFDGERIWFVGRDYSGVAFVQRRNSLPEIMNDYDIACLKHLPDCTGWDWVKPEPETFPQYWSANSKTIAFFRRDSADRLVGVFKNGCERVEVNPWDTIDADNRTRLTEAEALALLDPKPVADPDAGCWHITHDYSNSDPHHCRKPCVSGTLFCAEHQEDPKPKPAEDPEEWVEITDPEHVLRACCEMTAKGNGKHRGYVRCAELGNVGKRVAECPGFYFRCRRKDLPKPRCTVTVPKWLVVYSDGKVGVYETDSKPRVDSVHKEVHRVGETTYEI